MSSNPVNNTLVAMAMDPDNARKKDPFFEIGMTKKKREIIKGIKNVIIRKVAKLITISCLKKTNELQFECVRC